MTAAGVGITPLRAIMEDLPAETDVDVLYRARTAADLVLRDELDDLAAARPHTRVRKLVGSRAAHPMSPESLTGLLPDGAAAEVFVCGPDGFTRVVTDSFTRIGVRPGRVHTETFQM